MGTKKHMEKIPLTCFSSKKEKKTHTERHQEWGGERNDNMLAAGFVETIRLFTVIQNNI